MANSIEWDESIIKQLDPLDFYVRGEIKSFKCAVKEFEDNFNRLEEHKKNPAINYLIKCLKNFYKTKAFKSIENIKNSFLQGEINQLSFSSTYKFRDVADPNPETTYIDVPCDYDIIFKITDWREYELKVIRNEDILFEFNTDDYKKTGPVLSSGEYNFLYILEFPEHGWVCRNKNGDIFILDSINPPLLDSAYDSEAIPSTWISDIKNPNRTDIDSDFFTFIKWEDQKCWSKKEIKELMTTVVRLEV